MTFDERVQALEPLGFSERQTRFLVTVALHSGFCLHRHYAAFGGLAYGEGVRDFFERLVTRKLATRLTFRRNRGHVYHLQHRAIYKAIGQDDNPVRRLMQVCYLVGSSWVQLGRDRAVTGCSGADCSQIDHGRP